MKPGGSPFLRSKSLISALAIIVGWLFVPAYCQTSDVALLLQQTPNKGGAITPDAGVYHYKQNSEVIVTAAPKPGYQFAYWIGDVSDPAAISTMVYLDKPKIIIAVFEQGGNGVPAAEKGISGGGGGGGGGGSGFVSPAMTFGQAGSISGVAGGVKPKIYKSAYPKSEVIPEPATCLLLGFGSLFAFVRRRAKSRP
ncbi:MAG: PEP-CTERM sorting domain-containing protein [Planctomycetes bacterium]|nr:PEP-CTERM sorting domain-containing protein [Planctomycetota bacterium]MBL7145745.1 PEP-CTERM sorting domain-containing protein [Phycisphaerae bacterium]